MAFSRTQPQFSPTGMQSRGICLAAIYNVSALAYIINQTEEIILAALATSIHAFKYVKEGELENRLT